MKKILTKNLPLKILAFVCAAFLWLIVVNIDDPVTAKTYSNIKVTVTHEEVVTNKGRTYHIIDGTETVSVVVRAKRSVLNDIHTEDIVVTADMKELTLGTQIPLQVSIGEFEGKYVEAVTNPKNLQVKIEENASNKFPITPSPNGTVRDGYALGTLKVEPEKVTIAGPESVVNKIDRVVAEVNVSGLAKDTTIESELILYDAENNTIDSTLLSLNLDASGVVVEVAIHKVKALPIHFDTSGITTGEGYYLGDVTGEPKEIQVSGEDEALDQIESIEVPKEALVLEQLTERTETMVDITDYLPEGIKLVDENSGSVIVTVNVEQGGVKTISVPVRSITVHNISTGFKSDYGTLEDITLRISGPNDILDNLVLTSKNISINLVQYQTAGTYEVPVEVTLPPGCSLSDSVTVTVNLVKE